MWGGVIPAGTGPELPEGTGNEAQEGLSDSTKRGPCRGALTGGGHGDNGSGGRETGRHVREASCQGSQGTAGMWVGRAATEGPFRTFG